MKIAVWWHLHPGGARRALYDHVRGLAARGHEIHVVRPPVTSPETMSPDAFAASVQIVPLREFRADAKSYLGRVRDELARVRHAVPAMEAHCAVAGAAIRELKPDVLYASTCWLMAAPSIVRHVGDLPRVVYLQEPKRSLYEAQPTLPWIEPAETVSFPARIRRRLSLRALAHQARIERENALAAGTLLVNSHFSRESVRRAYGIDAEVCYLGVDTGHFIDAGRNRERFVLGVGAVVPTKGIDEAIAACRAAEMRLVWVGPFEDEVYGPELRRLGGEGVEWRIGISDEELIGLYARCTALIATAPLEPFGYTPIEAGACGTPVVALAQGGFRETVADGETGFLGATTDDLASALARLGRESVLAERLGREGRARTETVWSLDAATDRIEGALERATKKGGDSPPL